MKRTLWISLRRLKIHEFNTTLRVLLKKEDNWALRFTKLSELQTEAITQYVKICSTLLVSYLLLSAFSDGMSVTIRIGEVSATVSKPYYLAVTSALFFFSTVSLNHLLAVMSLRIRLSSRAFPNGFSANVFGLINGWDENALGIPQHQSTFFKEKLPISAALSSLLLVTLGSMLIPVISFGAFILSIQLEMISLPNIGFLERLACAAGFFIVISSYLNVIFFNTPLPFKKNTSSIRWGFLYSLPGPYDDGQIESWLADRKQK